MNSLQDTGMFEEVNVVVFTSTSLTFLVLGIDGPVASYATPPESSVGGLLVNVGSEEEEPQPRTKVSDMTY